MSEKMYNTYYGKCQQSTPDGSYITDLLSSTCTCSSKESFLQNAKDIQEQVFFDVAASHDVDQKSCKLTYLDQFDSRQEDPQMKTASDTVKHMKKGAYPELQKIPEPAKSKDLGAVRAIQANIARNLVASISNLQKIDKEIKQLENLPYSAGASAYGSPETVKAVAQNLASQPERLKRAKAVRSMIYKSIWNIEEPEMRQLFDELYSPFKDNSQAPDFPAELYFQKLVGKDSNYSIQSRVIEKMKSRTASEIGLVNYQKKSYPDSYKRTLVKSGLIYDDIFKTGPSSTFYSSMQCKMESRYGKGDKMTEAAVDVGLTAVTLAAGGAPAVLRTAVARGLITAETSSILSGLALVTEGTTGLAGLAINNFSQKCSDRTLTVQPGVCGKVENLKNQTDPLHAVQVEFNASSCALSVAMDALQAGSLFRSLKLLSNWENGARDIEEYIRQKDLARLGKPISVVGDTQGKNPQEIFSALSDAFQFTNRQKRKLSALVKDEKDLQRLNNVLQKVADGQFVPLTEASWSSKLLHDSGINNVFQFHGTDEQAIQKIVESRMGNKSVPHLKTGKDYAVFTMPVSHKEIGPVKSFVITGSTKAGKAEGIITFQGEAANLFVRPRIAGPSSFAAYGRGPIYRSPVGRLVIDEYKVEGSNLIISKAHVIPLDEATMKNAATNYIMKNWSIEIMMVGELLLIETLSNE